MGGVREILRRRWGTFRASALAGSARPLCADDPRRNADRRGALRHIDRHDGVGADVRMVTEANLTDHFGARSDVNVSAQRGYATVRHAQRHLLEDQAIGPDHDRWVDDDAVRVRQEQATADARVDRDVGASHDLPEDVAQHCPSLGQQRPEMRPVCVPLVVADAQ